MSQVSCRPVSARVLDAAIAWQLCLDSGDDDAMERQAFAKWLASDDEHARAWHQLGLLDQRFSLATGPARTALLQSRQSIRQRLRKVGGGLAGVVLVGALMLLAGRDYVPIDYWLADQRTATGEQRSLTLSDGTHINLNTHSAIDVRFDDKRRLIVLQEGEILVETGHNDPRPFIVKTRDGNLRALGTRFIVKREEHSTRLSVLRSAVAAQPQALAREQIFRQGQQVQMRSDGLGPPMAIAPDSDAWTRGMLVVDNARLGDVIEQLARYRTGYLGVDKQVAGLRITGSFPLDNTDLALKAMLPTLPVQIEQHTPWWVTVVGKTANK